MGNRAGYYILEAEEKLWFGVVIFYSGLDFYRRCKMLAIWPHTALVAPLPPSSSIPSSSLTPAEV